MKPYHLIVLLLVCSILTRCKNEEVKPQVSTKTTTNTTVINSKDSTLNHPTGPMNIQVLVAKWSLVRDSIYNSMGNYPAARISNNIGAEGDYFDFRADGWCYTKTGNV